MFKNYVTSIGLVSIAMGCSDNKKSDPALPLLGNMVISESKNAVENAKFELRIGSCSKNVETGKAIIALSQSGDTNKIATISIFIKDFQSVPKSYTCKQAADNAAAVDSVGGVYDSCAVEFKVPATAAAINQNTYAMHRNTIATKPFTYAGECSVQISKVTPSISGTVSCKQMVQTGLEGSSRNPVDATVTATVLSDFNCAL